MKLTNKKAKIVSVLMVSVFLGIFAIATIQSNLQEKTMQTSSNNALSNQKIGWGIKRMPNHEQPDLGSTNKALINQYEGMAMGNKEKKYVYLTFDEGYEAGYTPKLLEVLKQNEVKAAFFITAHYLNTQPELVKQMIEEGHIVGNHTVNHKSMPDISNEQIQKEVMDLHAAIYQKFNYEMKYLRPPKGEFSQRTISYTNTLGYKTVMWSLAYDDWDENKQDREEYGKKKVLENIHPGAIILLHGNSKDNSNILDTCIKEIKQMGYEFKSLEEFQR